MAFDPKAIKESYTRYESPTGELPTGSLRLAEWYLRHTLQLQNIGKWLLIVWCVLTIGFSVWKWGEYLVVGLPRDRALLEQSVAQFENYGALQSRYAAHDILASSVRVFRASPGKYDFVTAVRNPNAEHRAYLRYHFSYPGGETGVAETVLLPGDERPVAVFGQESGQFPSAARLIIDETRFARIDPHQIPDVAVYMHDRLQFSASTVAITGDRLAFDVVNDSAYSYWQVVFYVEVLSGGETIGILYLPIEQFRANERRSIDVRLFSDMRGADGIRLTPVVDVFDSSIFIPPGL